MKSWLTDFKLKCQGINFFSYGKGKVEKIMNDLVVDLKGTDCLDLYCPFSKDLFSAINWMKT